MNEWTRIIPTQPGRYFHRNLENAGGRCPIHEREMFVGYVNFHEEPKRGHGTKPMPLGSGKLRACRVEHPMTSDSLTVQEWGGEWLLRNDAKRVAEKPEKKPLESTA
jgi:hypothetical protein